MQMILLDMSYKSVADILHAKQGDIGRKFSVTLTDNDVPHTIPDGSVVTVWYAAPGGSGNYTDIDGQSAWSVSGNTVTVELIAPMLSLPGPGLLCLTINDNSGTQMGTWNIPLMIERTPGANSETAQQYYSVFETLLRKVEAMGTVGAADWSINDPSAAGYIKNRTHWVEEGDLTYDGDMTGHEIIGADVDDNGEGTYLVKVSDTPMTYDELIGLTVVFHSYDEEEGDQEDEIVITADALEDLTEYAPVVACEAFYSVLEDTDLDGMAISAGIWFLQAYYPSDGSNMYCASLLGGGTTIHKLDNKFIDAEWMATGVLKINSTIVAEAEYEFTTQPEMVEGFGSCALEVEAYAYTDGRMYAVVYDGTLYFTKCIKNSSLGYYFGNLRTFLEALGVSYDEDEWAEYDTGEPFCIVLQPSSDNYVCVAEAGTHTVALYDATDNRLPEKYLPEGYTKDELVAAVIEALPSAEEVAF